MKRRTKKWFSTRKETPRQRIWRLSRQIDDLNTKYELYYEQPCLCSFCKNFWFDDGGYYHEDYDWGCDAGRGGINDDAFADCSVMHCREFKPKKNWQGSVSSYLTDILFKAVRELCPHHGGLKALQEEARELELRIKDLKQEYDGYLKRVYGAEVLDRMTNGK